MADGQVLIEITADNRSAERTIRETTQVLNQESTKWESSGDRLNNVFKKLAAGFSIAKIGQALLNLGKDALEAASDLEEVQNVVDVTFGESAKTINEWAKNAIQQFGLTETQAKQFTSTLGAMMKSSGVAGNEIVQMSTDLAGLAADMASFYNLDFETAFQKIRSGISGETEPLKQLGINMSVANLEAYALTQGITKSFESMSQGEQVMLRYQYLMQATADAQGDFARTQDGYANSTRLLESQLDSLRTKLGGPIKSVLSDVLSVANELIGVLFPGDISQHTILDDFAEIDAETQTRMAEVQATASAARDLVNILTDLNNSGYVHSAFAKLTEGAESLTSASVENWTKLLGAFNTNSTGLHNFLSASGDPAARISAMASALSGIDGDEAKRQAWLDLIGALSDNAEELSRYTGKSADAIRAELSAIAEYVPTIDANDAAAWDSLMSTLVKATEGFVNTETLNAMSTSIGGIATNAGKLTADSEHNWSTFLTSLQGIDGLSNIWGKGNLAAANIGQLASALSDSGINSNRAHAWQTILSTLGKNVGTLAELRGEDEEDTWNWLTTLANAANTLNPESADGWDTLFTWLVQGIPGLEDTEGGRRLLEALSGPQAQVTRASDDALQVMQQLGIATEGVTDQNALWLATCRELVRLIPSLSSIINTETGEIIGGAQAVTDYIDAWEMETMRQLEIEALQRKIAAYQAEASGSRADVRVRENVLRSLLGEREGNLVTGLYVGADTSQRLGANMFEFFPEWISSMARAGHSLEEIQRIMHAEDPNLAGDVLSITSSLYTPGSDREKEGRVLASQFYGAADARMREELDLYTESLYERWYQEEIMPRAYSGIQEDINRLQAEGVEVTEELADTYGTLGDAAEGAAAAVATLSDEEKKSWDAAIKAAQDAAAAVLQYQQQVLAATNSTLSSWGNMFAAVESGADQTRRKIREELGDDFTETEYEVRVGTSGIATASSMLANLTNRLTYLTNYSQMMEQARNMGYSDEVLAQLADGSLESYDYLVALTSGNASYVEQINAAYAEVGRAQQDLARELSGYQLQADEQYGALVNTLESALNDLDEMAPTDAPALAIGSTIDQVLEAISTRYPQLATSVDNVLGLINQLTGTNYGDFSTSVSGGHLPGMGGGFSFAYGVNGSHASGLDYVPFDGYLARLHMGESVLTAQEAQVWREFRAGLDVNSITGAIWDNAPNMGGNVYLNGEAVGRIMSAAQADSYRQLERSGWRG